MKRVIHTHLAPAPVGPYNQAIQTSDFIFVAGQIPLDPMTSQVVGEGNVTKQTEQVIANIQAILQAAGANLGHVVKTTVYLADMNDFAEVNAVYARYFDGAIAPARACVEVARLPKNVQIEIDCIAVYTE